MIAAADFEPYRQYIPNSPLRGMLSFDQVVVAWQKYLPNFFPKEVLDALLLPGYDPFTCNISPTGGEKGLTIKLLAMPQIRGPETPYYSIAVHLYENETPKLSNVDVSSNGRGRGIARSLLARFANVIEAHDQHSMSIIALDDGRRVWPKFGMIPAPEYWLTLQEGICSRLDYLESNSTLSHAQTDALRHLMDQHGARAVWAIADLHMPVATPNGPTLPLGNYLMEANVTYHGLIDLNDVSTRQKFNAYTGRSSSTPISTIDHNMIQNFERETKAILKAVQLE